MRRPLFMICLCLVTIAAVRLWFNQFPDRREGYQSFFPKDGEVITVAGRVSEKSTKEIIIDSITLSYAADSQQTIPIEEKLICEWQETEELRLGSTVVLNGVVEDFSTATNPGEFDVAKYYETMEIGGRLVNVSLVSQSSDYSVVKEGLYQLRGYFKERLYTVFPEKEASILTAMLLGDKEELNRDIKELYQKNGIVHILSISGVKTLLLV